MENLLIKTVDFEGDQLKAAQEKESNKVYVGVSYVCNGLRLSKSQKDTQVQKIQSDMVLKRGCLKLQAGVFDPNNEAWAIELDFLPLWLAKISITPAMKRNNPFVVQKLVDYQLKAKDVLAKAFIKDQQPMDRLSFMQSIVDQFKDQQKQINGIKSYLISSPDRKKLEREVNAFVRRTQIPHAHVWKMIYDKIEDKYGIDIPQRVQHKQEFINKHRQMNGKKPYKLITLQNKYNGVSFLSENKMFPDVMEILAGLYDENTEEDH